MRIADGALVAEVRRLAAERPDFVYEKQATDEWWASGACLYVHQDEHQGLVAGCLIGHALANLGVPLELLSEFDRSGDDTSADALLPKFGVSGTVTLWAMQAQLEQDEGQPWGRAVELADGQVNLDGV